MAKSKKSSKARRIGHPSHIGSSQSKLEGPIRTRSGKVVYYDPGEGAYYDRSTDLYLSEEETRRLHLNPTPEVAALGAGLGGYLAGPLGAGLGAYLGAKTAETEETKALEKHLKKMGKEKVDAVLDKLGVERNPKVKRQRPKPLVSRDVFDEVRVKDHDGRSGVAFSSMAGVKKYLKREYGSSVTVAEDQLGGYGGSHGKLLIWKIWDVFLDGEPTDGYIFRYDYFNRTEDKKPFKREFVIDEVIEKRQKQPWEQELEASMMRAEQTYRITRNAPYPRGSIGFEDLSARQGYYVKARTPQEAAFKFLKDSEDATQGITIEGPGGYVDVVKMGNNPVNLKDLKAKIAASMRGAAQRFRPSRITDDELKTYAQAKAGGTVGYVNLQLADPKSHARYERALRSRMPDLYNRIEASKRGKRAAWKAQDDIEMDREEAREERRAHLRDLLRDIDDRPQRKKKSKKKTAKKKTAKKSARSNPSRLANKMPRELDMDHILYVIKKADRVRGSRQGLDVEKIARDEIQRLTASHSPVDKGRELFNLIDRCLEHPGQKDIQAIARAAHSLLPKTKTGWKYLSSSDELERDDSGRVDMPVSNLAGAFLVNAHLDNANLQAAALDNAKLQNARLNGANLKRAKLRGTNLRHAHLQDAHLQGAVFIKADLRHAKIQRSLLIKANLDDAKLQNANFEGADLTSAKFEHANLTNANFEGAVLTNANFYEANLQGTNFEGANLQGVDLYRANLSGADLRGAVNLKKAKKLHLAKNLKSAHLPPGFVIPKGNPIKPGPKRSPKKKTTKKTANRNPARLAAKLLK